MLEDKVTRRAAFGLGAVLFAGANALIYRAISRSRDRELPAGKFFQEWDGLVKRLDVPIKDIEGPTSCTLEYKPVIGTKVRALVVDTNYGPNTYPSAYPHPPSFYIVTEARLERVASIVAKKPAVSIVTERHAVNFPDGLNEESLGQWVAVIDEDPPALDIACYDVNSGPPKRCLPSEVNSGCWRIMKTLRRSYASGKTLTRGAQWNTPKSVFGFEMPVEAVGFAEINARATVKVSGRKHLDPPEVADYMLWMAGQQAQRQAAESATNRGATDEENEAERREIIEKKESREYELTEYIDLDSGLTVRSEFSGTIRLAQEPPTCGGSIVQLSEA